MLLDIVNKIILDLGNKEAERKYYEEVKTNLSKLQNIFENYKINSIQLYIKEKINIRNYK